MTTIGAVLQVDPQRQDEVLRFLEEHPAITPGEPQTHGLPVAIQCRSRGEVKALWDALERQPGILFTGVVFADYSELVEGSDD